MGRFKGRVTDAMVLDLLAARSVPRAGILNQIHEAWEDLKQERGWRPHWAVRSGLLLNGLSEARAQRILRKYREG